MDENIKHLVFGICVAIVLLSAFAGVASATTWYVEEGESIQTALDAASSGDTIIVRDGTYTENIDVNVDNLTIRSENGTDFTIVHAFEVTADYANISGFTVKGTTIGGAGINLRADHCEVSNNNCSNNDYGILLFGSSSNNIMSNTINSNNYYGILLCDSSNNTLTNNMMSENDYNFYVWGHSLSHYIHNIDTTNKVDGKTIYYWVNQQNRQIPDDAGYVGVVNSTNITVKDLTLTDNGQGVLFEYTKNSRIENVSASNNHNGILLDKSSNNNIMNNTVNSNNYNGIFLYSSSNNILTNNTASNNHRGISLYYSSSNILTNNTASSNRYGGIFLLSHGGIYLYSSSNNNITSNTVNSNYDYGICLHSSSNNILTSNTVNSNYDYGIFFERSNNNTLTNNMMSENDYNFGVLGRSLSQYIHSIDTANKVDGKTVYYWVNQQNRQIPADAGYVGVVNSTNITVKDLTLTNNGQGVLFVNTSNSKIENVNASNNYYGISLSDYSSNNKLANSSVSNNYDYGISLSDYSSNNKLANNSVLNNHDIGIVLYYSSSNILTNNTANLNFDDGIYLSDSSNNILTNNTANSNARYGIHLVDSSNNRLANNAASNNDCGIYLVSSSNNTITGNTCENNCGNYYYGYYGIYLCYSNSNKIYLNNFINNDNNVYSESSSNIWNSTSPIKYTYNGSQYTNYLGNYWDDYSDADTDGDGIWDNPYSIDGDKDYYPLKERFENYVGVLSEQPQLKAPWNDTAKISQGNNGSSHKDYGTWDNTYAVDVALPVGSDVFAPAGGTVIWYDDDPGGAGGKELAIQHTCPTGKNFVTVYLHLSDIIVKGGAVKQGQVVAKSGDTGDVTGAHLHFHLWSGVGSYDSHTIPIERLVMKQVGVDSDFREYDARKGDLEDNKIAGNYFQSNNAIPTIEYNPILSIPVYAPLLQQAHKGTNLTYIFKVKNNGSATDTIDLSASDTLNWKIQLSKASVTLASGESTDVSLNVTIEENKFDKIIITGTSRGNISKNSSCTASAYNMQDGYGLFAASLQFSNKDTEEHTLTFNVPDYVKISDKTITLSPSENKQVTVVFNPKSSESDLNSIYIDATDITSGESVRIPIEFIPTDEIIATNYDMAKDSYSFQNWGIVLPICDFELTGHCYGMSETSILYFRNIIALPNNKPNIYSLTKDEAKWKITLHQWRWSNTVAGGKILLSDIDEEKEYNELEENIRNGKPMILATKRHAVLAYKIIKQGDKSYISIYNSEQPYSISTDSFYLSFPYATYNLTSHEFNYEGDTKFLVQEAKKLIFEQVILSVECPVNVTITDQYNRIISDNGTNEILNATIISTNGTKIFYLPANLTYNVNVSAYGVGNFTLTKVAPITTEIAVINVFDNISITNKTKATLEIAPNEMNQTMDIDYNGDGVIDEVKNPDVNETITVSSPENIFDTSSPANPYPSIMGNHTGTIKPNHTVIATKLYTYSCEGTGGHTEYARIGNKTWNATAIWEGYAGDWHNISFDKTVVLLANETYSYTIRTGSYPQIHHNTSLLTANGWINCSQFTDANGKRYNNWVPAIRVW